MTPHLRDYVQLSATGPLSISNGQPLRSQLECEREVRRPRYGTAIAAAAILSFLAIPAVEITHGWPFDTTLRHFAAAAGCTAARAVKLAPARAGEPGYWPWLDRNSSGVSCLPR